MIEYTVRVDEYITEWWLNGKLHRVDGPAVDRVDGSKEWWLDGEKCTEETLMETKIRCIVGIIIIIQLILIYLIT